MLIFVLVLVVLGSLEGRGGDHGDHDHGGHDHGDHNHDHHSWGGHNHHDHDHKHGGNGFGYRPFTGFDHNDHGHSGGGGGLFGLLFGRRSQAQNYYYYNTCRVVRLVDYVGTTPRYYCDCPPYAPNYQYFNCVPMATGK
ncbi:unnamed protein product [Caenorhabditis angaria]|uniref:Uncharacterized protein n=1 Tax=Caenorhabditis angaria TaxID=860376 RepID=A0A9P1IFB4_9PELO|nr:unnamed protein product [Caenorhabditis angaria]